VCAPPRIRDRAAFQSLPPVVGQHHANTSRLRAQALPIDGVTLVAEQHSDLDQAIAAGKNGKTGKNGHGGAYQLGGGHGNLFGTSVGTDMGGQELVAIDLR
jgi:hypothetical protein